MTSGRRTPNGVTGAGIPTRATLLTLLVLALLPWACDRDISDPLDGTVVWVATVEGPSGATIGAALLSIEGEVEAFADRSGLLLVYPDGARTVAAVVSPHTRSSLSLAVEVADGTAPRVEVLQVADDASEPYPDPSVFTVRVEEDEEARP